MADVSWTRVWAAAIGFSAAALFTLAALRPPSPPPLQTALAAAASAGVGAAIGDIVGTSASLNFLVCGDWGTGDEAQLEVADALGKSAGDSAPLDFVLSPGDQIYPAGAATASDGLFAARFERVYPDRYPALRVPWLMALGNHDCAGNPDAEVQYTARSRFWHMPKRYYTREFALPGAAHPVRVVVLDACGLVCGGDDGKANFRCEEEILASIVRGARAKQLQWLDRELAKPAAWKIVVSHWPIFSFLGNGPSAAMTDAVLPMLLRHRADAFFSGHDHSMQHIELKPHARASHPRPPHFFVAGGGGYMLHPVLKPEAETAVNRKAKATFAEAVHGFMRVVLTADAMRVTIVRASDGAVVHSATIAHRVL